MKEIKRYLDGRDGEYSFYFEDLKSDYTYGLNENKEMIAAGCIKIPIAMVAMKKIENNDIDIDFKVNISKDEMVEGRYSIIHEFQEREYSIKELIVAMLLQSDNTAACKIVSIIGIDSINEMINSMGLHYTRVRKYPSENRVENENITTAKDMNTCMKLLKNNSYLNSSNSQFILEILEKQHINTGIPFYLPIEVQNKIANKSGTLKNVENDVALINMDKGNFVFSVMSKNLPSNVYGLSTISRVGKMMFDIIDKDWK